jgi:hypothetical protein
MSHPTHPRARALNWSIFVVCLFVLALALAAGGCSKTPPSLLPNKDKALRKSATSFQADAKQRHPYKADAPKAGTAVARAQVGYSLDQLEVVNLSEETWNDVEVWVNERWVVFVPQMKPFDLKVLNFRMMYNDKNEPFPMFNTNDAKRVEKVEILWGGQMYNIPVALAD